METETTIQISHKLHEALKVRKISKKETYEEVIWDLLEDTMELSEETKMNISKSEKEIREGKTASLSEIEKRLGM